MKIKTGNPYKWIVGILLLLAGAVIAPSFIAAWVPLDAAGLLINGILVAVCWIGGITVISRF